VSDELMFSKWGEEFTVSGPSAYVVATNAYFP
jgi:hypothetical protein